MHKDAATLWNLLIWHPDPEKQQQHLVPSVYPSSLAESILLLSFSSGRGEKSSDSLHSFLGTSWVPGSLLNAPDIALSVRTALCLHPRVELLGLASLVESSRHRSVPTAAQGSSAAALDVARPSCQWLLYFISLCCCFPGSMWSSAVSSGFYREWVNTLKWSLYGISWQCSKLSHCQGVLFIQQLVPRKQPI